MNYLKKEGEDFRPLTNEQADFDQLDENGIACVHHTPAIFTSFTESERRKLLNIYSYEPFVLPLSHKILSGPTYVIDGDDVVETYETEFTSVVPLVYVAATEAMGRPLTAEEMEFVNQDTRFDADTLRTTQFGGLYVRDFILKRAGDVHQGHKHIYDHITYLHGGGFICQIEGFEDKVFEGPVAIPIKAEHHHRFIAITDSVYYSCIFPWRGSDGEITDVFTHDQSPYGWAPTTTAEMLAKIKGGCASCENSAGCSAT